jgi:hypothetical protein
MMVTTGRVFMGTQAAASLHGRSMAEDVVETTATYVMSSTPETHVTGSKINTEIRSVKSKNNARKGTMIIMVLTMTNHTGSSYQKWDTSQEASRRTP